MSGVPTPGPWAAQCAGGIWSVTASRPATGKKGGWPYYAICSKVGGDDAERKANAALIAAAPDLLARCEYGEAENLELAHRNAALETERDGLRTKLTLATLNAETFERQYRQVCQDHAGMMATVHVLRTEIKRFKEANAATAETIQTLLDLLNPLHGELDRQTFDDKMKENFDAPADREYNVDITARMERDLTQAVMILEDRKAAHAKATEGGFEPRDADEAAVRLNLVEADRRRLGITTIGAVDVDRAERARRRKERDRKVKAATRRAKGARPRDQYEAQSLSRTKPWQALGMSRASWYRQRQRGKPQSTA